MDSARLIKAALTVSLLTVLCPRAIALNPSLDINQYAHNAWLVRDGFFGGAIFAITQTPDGYLWLGTEFGLSRFDGVRSVLWQPPNGEHLPGGRVRSLLVARDGGLWIGTEEGLARWKGGWLTRYASIPGIAALLEDREGTIWIASGNWKEGVCAIQSEVLRCYGEESKLGSVMILYEDSGNNLWLGTPKGLWRWKPGIPEFYPTREMPISVVQGDDGTIVVTTRSGIDQLVNGKIGAFSAFTAPLRFYVGAVIRDRQGSLWVGTAARGLVHLHNGKVDLFAHADGLSGDSVYYPFEDREGNIWVPTTDGLDRFREFAIRTVSVKQGLANAAAMSVLSARDGSIWAATLDGLTRWRDGQVAVYRKRDGLPDDSTGSLYEDDSGRIWVSTVHGVAYFEKGRFIRVTSVPAGTVNSFAGDAAGNLWIVQATLGLFRLAGASVVERIAWAKLGHKDYAEALLHDPVGGGLWLGFNRGGLSYFKDGQIRQSYAAADGLGLGRVWHLRFDPEGALWAATQGGVSRVKDGRIMTLTSRNGLPCDTVHWTMEDDDHSFWLYTACGLVQIRRADLNGWIAGSKRNVRTTIFDSSDGVRNHVRISGYSPRVVKANDGKIWFAPFDGVAVIDPRHLPVNTLPPPAHIEHIIANRKVISDRRLPALTRDLEIQYTALSFVAPEKVRFKYKLEGYDRDWVDAGNRRQAFYDNLGPRSYRFRVIASNNSGVWNETGDTLEFSIAPAYYQTNWFRVSLAAAFFLALWGLYRLRRHQLVREFNAQLEGRVDERLRVARDLHDTLLQSFQGLIPVFQTARNLLPTRADRAAEVLDEGLKDAAEAIVEGRNAIQNLRTDPSVDPALGPLLNAAGEELAHSPEAEGSAPAFRVVVEGPRRPLAPLVRDEAYRIGREMLRNAFRHAHAGRIEAEIRYDPGTFRLRIRDDGKGIESSVLKEGVRHGHWGIPGMHERAKSMGGRLKFWSEPGAGTEAELTIPARIAYEKFSASNGWRARLGRRLRLTAPNREV